MQEMLKKASVVRRSPLAAEPAGPLELPHHVRSSSSSSKDLVGWTLPHNFGRGTTIAVCLAVQLLAVLVVYAAHAAVVAPRLRGGEDTAAAVHGRLNLLEQQPIHSMDSQLRGWSLRAGAPPASGRPSSSGDSAMGPPGAAKCTVHLGEADEQLLRAEIDRIAKSLADDRGWPLGASDATAAEELGGKVSRGEAFKPAGAVVQRIVDESFGPQSSVNVPGVEDIHAELAKYNDDMLATMTVDAAEAAGRQQRTRAADLGLTPVDGLGELGSLASRVEFLNRLHGEVEGRERLKVCIAATTNADLWGLRREVLPWLQYHVELGVSRFYLLYDGTDTEAVELLQRIHHVRLIHLHPPWATSEEKAKFEFYSKQAQQWGGQPGNYELMVKQGYGEQEALRLAELDGVDWLLHIDPDELFHPGGPAASITAVLARQPPHVPSVRFMNFEGQPEAGDIANRFEQVTLFRVHKHFITPEAHYYRPKYKLGDNAVFLTLYANGKSAVRVGAGARQMGPHFFAGNPSPRWQTQENPRGEWRDVVSDDSVILHYAYATMADVEAKANRSCPASYLEAARRGDRSKIKDCFVIDFDQDAYLAAAAGRAAVEDFFYSRMVLSEGSRVRCRDPDNGNIEGWCTLASIERFKHLMEKVGLFRRIHGPQLILRLHERAIQATRERGGKGGGEA